MHLQDCTVSGPEDFTVISSCSENMKINARYFCCDICGSGSSIVGDPSFVGYDAVLNGRW